MTVTFNDDAIGALEFSVQWEKDGYTHEERFLGRKFNPVNDIFPRGMREALEGKKEGDSVTFEYEPRMCIPRYKESQVLRLPLHRLRKKTLQGDLIIPKVGRFFPQGHISQLRGIYPDTLNPFRLIGLSDTEFVADCNHPLATIPVTLTATIQYLEHRDVGTYGSLTHWREATCDWGPGMQAMFDGDDTEFSTPCFYSASCPVQAPFSPPPMDEKARENINAIQSRFLTPDMRILDASINAEVSPSGKYDGALAIQTMEYIESPGTFLQTLSDNLKPGSPVVFAFTNQFDPTHTIQGWCEMHEFERMGYILQLMRQAGLDDKAGTVSMRNDWRNKDDLRFLETRGVSDPVYVVYGHKR